MSIILRSLAFAIGTLSGVIELRGQGGPPMITDDPGTPGPNKWEINLAVAWAHRPAETSLGLPAIDLNYGLGERIQLTLQTAPVLLKRRERGPIWGLGATEAALKWRFLDEQQNGISVESRRFRGVRPLSRLAALRGGKPDASAGRCSPTPRRAPGSGSAAAGAPRAGSNPSVASSPSVCSPLD
jgi:hypothetical protein